jgi:hypothetical protein
MMAERVGATGSVTGIDIAGERLNACKSGVDGNVRLWAQ